MNQVENQIHWKLGKIFVFFSFLPRKCIQQKPYSNCCKTSKMPFWCRRAILICPLTFSHCKFQLIARCFCRRDAKTFRLRSTVCRESNLCLSGFCLKSWLVKDVRTTQLIGSSRKYIYLELMNFNFDELRLTVAQLLTLS